MKTLKLIADFLVTKIFVVTMLVLMLISTELIFGSLYQKDSSPRQMMLTIILIIMPLVVILVCHKMVIGIGWRISNYICAVFVMFVGISLGYNYRNQPNLYSETKHKYTISETKSDKLIIEVDGYEMCYTYVNLLKYDSIHPVKVYDSYKIDIFGDKTPSYIVLKSDLMKDYVYTQVNR